MVAEGLAWGKTVKRPDFEVLVGDCRVRMADLPDESIDACVTDPPYEIGFMNRGWDSSGVAFDHATWRQVYRVLKPGGHLISFCASRTYHRMACAIEDVGFEIRDQIDWIYGTGFPHSLNVAKEVDQHLGVEPTVVATETRYNEPSGLVKVGQGERVIERKITAATSPQAKQWEGWGTSLKPAHEPACLARKPCSESTVAGNVLRHGTGAMNIGAALHGTGGTKMRPDGTIEATGKGRWPANIMLDDDAAVYLDNQAGKASAKTKPSSFFFCPKPSRRERDLGCSHLAAVTGNIGVGAMHEKAGNAAEARNFHPTVKPVALMRYLVRLVTPAGGVVLDPFTGSGTTGMGALLEGFDFLGCELTPSYLPIIHGRLSYAQANFSPAQETPT